LKQLHPSGLPIAEFVLVDLRHQVDRVAAERFRSSFVKADLDVHDGSDCSTLDTVCARYSSECILPPLTINVDTDAELVDRLALFVRSNLSHRLTARDIAAALDCSPRHLAAVARANLRCTVKQYVRQQRLETALVLIRAGDKIESVLTSVGYGNRTSFFSDFRREFGMLPSTARASREPSARCS